MSNPRTVPRFASEDEEREFWGTHDATDFADWAEAEPAVFANLRPTTRTISLRLPESLLESLKVAAHKRDVPYQALIKMILSEAVERGSSGAPGTP